MIQRLLRETSEPFEADHQQCCALEDTLLLLRQQPYLHCHYLQIALQNQEIKDFLLEVNLLFESLKLQEYFYRKMKIVS